MADAPKRALIAVRRGERGMPLAAIHARYLAERIGAELVLATCIYDSSVAFRLARGDRDAASAQAGMLRDAERDLDGLAQSLRDWGVPVTTKAIWEQPVYAGLLRAVEECGADLLVLGAHEPRLGVPHTRLTATDWQVMRLAPCPILLVKDPEFDGYERILAAVDPVHMHAEPSGLDDAVLEAACGLARALDAELRIAHAYPDPADYSWVSAVEVLPGVFYGNENIERVHERAVLELVGGYGITADAVDLRAGKPAEVIAALAAERRSKLVIVGATRRGVVEQALLGSTAEVVAVESPCDVLLVPAPRRSTD